MKILHIQTAISKSGNGPYNLHKELLKKKIDSKMLVLTKNFKADKVVEYNNIFMKMFKPSRTVAILSKIENFFISLIYKKKIKLVFCSGRFGFKLSKHPLVKEADIIHLHWINYLLNVKEVKKILKEKKVIWTFRDSWPYTAGCHVKIGCTEYNDSCANCFIFKRKKLFGLFFKFKEKNLKGNDNLVIVSQSENQRKEIRNSKIFKDYFVNKIGVNVDQEIFKKKSKQEVRKKLKLSNEKKYILFGASSPNNFYKGWREIKECLKLLKSENYKNIELLIFGSVKDKENKIFGFSTTYFGKVDEEKLSMIYSASDIFLAPSLEESFGKVHLESILCGTPVVAFLETGVTDIIEHKKNGYLAKYKNIKDLKRGVDYCLNNELNVINYNKNLRTSVIINQYINLYKELLEIQ